MKCEQCSGTGKVHSHNDICWVCDGRGEVPDSRSVQKRKAVQRGKPVSRFDFDAQALRKKWFRNAHVWRPDVVRELADDLRAALDRIVELEQDLNAVYEEAAGASL